MLVELDYGLLAKYVLYVDSVFMLVCAHLLYLKDVSQLDLMPRYDESVSVLNAKIFFFGNCTVCALIFVYLLRPITCLLLVFAFGAGLQLVCRLLFAYYFYFFLNLANAAGLGLAFFYLYVLWQDLDTRTILSVPDCFGDQLPPPSRRRRRSSRHRRRSHKAPSSESYDEDDEQLES